MLNTAEADIGEKNTLLVNQEELAIRVVCTEALSHMIDVNRLPESTGRAGLGCGFHDSKEGTDAVKHKMEPERGLEPPSNCLQDSCISQLYDSGVSFRYECQSTSTQHPRYLFPRRGRSM